MGSVNNGFNTLFPKQFNYLFKGQHNSAGTNRMIHKGIPCAALRGLLKGFQHSIRFHGPWNLHLDQRQTHILGKDLQSVC